MSIEFKRTGFKKFKAKYESAYNAGEVAGVIDKDIEENYEKSITPEGSPLKPLSTFRILQKLEYDYPYPDKPMVASGQLEAATQVEKSDSKHAAVTVNESRTPTPDTPPGGITNIEILMKHESTRPTFGIGTKTKEKIRKFIGEKLK